MASISKFDLDNMADENVPAPAPTRSDNQILPFAAWNTLTYEAKTGAYSFQLDKTRFVLDTNLLRDALKITPIDQAYQFVSPPSGDAIMDFVNELGYTEQSTRRAGKTSLFAFIPFLSILRNLDNLKFVPKGEGQMKSFECQFLTRVISNISGTHRTTIAYMEMVAKHDQKIAAEKGEKKKPATAKQPKPKPAKEKSSKPAPAPKPKAQSQAHVGGVAIREPVAEATRPLPVVKGKGKAITTEEQAAQSLLADDTSANIVCDSPSLADAETGADTDKTNNGCDTEILQIGEEQGDDVANVVNLKEKTAEIYKGQVESDPSKTPESRPPPEQVFIDEDQAGPDPGESHVALA
ncbi:hypothetical protein Tco_1410297 [Tanacetum coccineum]